MYEIILEKQGVQEQWQRQSLQTPNVCYIFLKTEVQGYQIWYFLPNFQQQITKKIPHKFSIKYFSHQIFSTNKFHSNILPKMFYQKISTKSVPPSFFLFHISLMTNSRSFLLIVLYHLCMYYNCLLVLDLCNKDSILDHSNFSNILLQYFKIISSVACSQLLSYTPQLDYSAMMQWCPLRGIDSNKLQWKTRRRHPTLPAHRPIHTQQCWPLQSGLPDVRLLLGSPRYDKNSLAKWGHGWWWDALHRWLSARQCA